MSEKILIVEYEKILDEAIKAFDELLQFISPKAWWKFNKKVGPKSKAKAIAFLSDKSLRDWPKTVRRFKEYYQSRSSRK